ncbi:Hpt domain-containing protein [Desulfotalea psychrophila]|nr:Hpt domain-containing protein [Desulfotalea psychrophila]
MCEEVSRTCIKKHLLEQFGLEEAQIDALIPRFCTAMIQNQQELDTAIASAVMADIARAAHKIKGALLNLGLQGAGDCALTIEQAAKQESVSFDFSGVSGKLAEILRPLQQ